jgi:hypothetical protein
LVTFRHKRFRLDPESNWVFTARQIEKTPVRTYGRLRRDEQGRLVLRYRPWLVLPARTLALPAGRYVVGRGLFYPEIRRLEGREEPAQLTLPPCYRTKEEEVARLYQCVAVQDIGLRRGLKAAWTWVRSLFGSRRPVTPVATPA